jgi:hypothetical protein
VTYLQVRMWSTSDAQCSSGDAFVMVVVHTGELLIILSWYFRKHTSPWEFYVASRTRRLSRLKQIRVAVSPSLLRYRRAPKHYVVLNRDSTGIW